MADRSWCRIEFAAKDKAKVLQALGREPNELGERFLELRDSSGGGWQEQSALITARVAFIAVWDGCVGSYSAGSQYYDGKKSREFLTNEDAKYLPMVAVGENLTLERHTLAEFRRDLRLARRVRNYIIAN